MLPSEGRRVLLVDPDSMFAENVVEALRGAGFDAQSVGDAASGLRRLAAMEPDTLIVELEMAEPERNGAWLLRRLRDEYMGTRPRVIAVARPETVSRELADLGCDALVVKPVSPAVVLAAVAHRDSADAGAETGRLRELVKLSLFDGDLDGAFTTIARRLALAFRTADAVVVGAVGDRQHVGVANQPVDEDPAAPVWDSCRWALDAGAPVLMDRATGVATWMAVPIQSMGGDRLGILALVDDRPRLMSAESLDGLRALGVRLHGEITWRSVHERIAADRDRLRESSMLDPLLGVWTRAALEQSLPAEVSAAQRRGEPLVLGVLDVRGLRHINERYGHVVGDAALQHVASLVRHGLRPQDIAARFSGDSVAIVLGGTTVEEALIVTSQIQETIASTPLPSDAGPLSICVVGGLAPVAGENDSGDAALLRAAAACRTARRRDEPLAVAGSEEAGEDPEAGELEHSLESGATLGGMYQIVHEISRGAMGVVYRAEDLGLGRTVALKTLRPDLARDKVFVERFRAEAATLASLRHENLVQVYAFGIDGEDVYFVMELVEGEPLEDRIELARSEGRLIPLADVERVINQVADALDAMHRAGVLHRDVKPANMLLDRAQARAVLVDVGIAKRRGSATDPAGTPGFTAPESFSGGREGPATDVYGLAATAYMLLSAEPPFGDDVVGDILKRQAAGRPQPASVHRPGLPVAVNEILLRALDPDPARRPISAGVFARQLISALGTASEEVRLGLDGAGGPQAFVPESEPAVIVEVPLLPPDVSTWVPERLPGPAAEPSVTARLGSGPHGEPGRPGSGPSAAHRRPGSGPPARPASGPRQLVVATSSTLPAVSALLSESLVGEVGLAVSTETPSAPGVRGVGAVGIAGGAPAAGGAVAEQAALGAGGAQPGAEGLGDGVMGAKGGPGTPVLAAAGPPSAAPGAHAVKASAGSLVGNSFMPRPAARRSSIRASLLDPERPPSSVPHTRGVLFRAAYRILGARQASNWLASLAADAPAVAQVLQPQTPLLSWHPTEVFVDMLRSVGAAGREPAAFARELGRVATRASFTRFFGADPMALSPWQVLSSADLYWRRYHTWGDVSVNRVGERSAEVSIVGGPLEPLVCVATAGILEQVAVLSGAGHAKVEHTACEAADSAACVFQVRWDETPPAQEGPR